MNPKYKVGDLVLIRSFNWASKTYGPTDPAYIISQGCKNIIGHIDIVYGVTMSVKVNWPEYPYNDHTFNWSFRLDTDELELIYEC